MRTYILMAVMVTSMLAAVNPAFAQDSRTGWIEVRSETSWVNRR